MKRYIFFLHLQVPHKIELCSIIKDIRIDLTELINSIHVKGAVFLLGVINGHGFSPSFMTCTSIINPLTKKKPTTKPNIQLNTQYFIYHKRLYLARKRNHQQA